MRRVGALVAAAACAAALGNPATAQAPADETGTRAGPQEPPGEPDFIVRGRRWGELRLEVQIAEEALYARFNEINSDDRFDVHCRSEQRTGTRIRERRCLSNDWREQDAKMAQEVLRQMRGESGGGYQQYQAEQRIMQQRLYDEMRRLAFKDEQLKEAVLRLGNAQLDLAAARGRPPALTREREVVASGELPFGAQRIFHVKIGADPWSHVLVQPTFTIAQVTGDIRDLELACEGGSDRFRFEPNVEWTVPDGWRECLLRVRAQRDTTFALYEF